MPIYVSAEVRTFLESLLQEAASEEPADELVIQRMARALDQRITRAIAAAVPAAQRKEFERLQAQQQPGAEIDRFISRYVPNVREVVQQARSAYRREYLQGLGG